MEISILSSLIRNKMPDAVVRDDHCDVVRVAWHQVWPGLGEVMVVGKS
jgi:hypothetical protein